MTKVSTAAAVPPPYYAVIFSSQLAEENEPYSQMANRMVELASQQRGFLGIESSRDSHGFGITVSYWIDIEAIAEWKAHTEHLLAQELGKQLWYAHYELKIARVERSYSKTG